LPWPRLVAEYAGEGKGGHARHCLSRSYRTNLIHDFDIGVDISGIGE